MDREIDSYKFPEEWKTLPVKDIVRGWIEQSGMTVTDLSTKIYGKPSTLPQIVGRKVDTKGITLEDIALIGKELNIDETVIDQLQQRWQWGEEQKHQELIRQRNTSTDLRSYVEHAKKIVGSNNKQLAEDVSAIVGRDVKSGEINGYFSLKASEVRLMPHDTREALPKALGLDDEQAFRFHVLSMEQSARYNQRLFPCDDLRNKPAEGREFMEFFKLCAENAGYKERELLYELGMQELEVIECMNCREPLSDDVLTRCMEKFEAADQALPESQRWYHRHVYRFDMKDTNRPLVDTGLTFPQTLQALHQKAVAATAARRGGMVQLTGYKKPAPSPTPPTPKPTIPTTKVVPLAASPQHGIDAGKPAAFAIEPTKETRALGAVYEVCLEKNTVYTEYQIARMLKLPNGMSDIAMLKKGRLWLEPDTQKQLVELFDDDSKKASNTRNGWFDAEDRLSLPVKPSLRTQLETAYAAVVPETLKKSEIMVG